MRPLSPAAVAALIVGCAAGMGGGAWAGGGGGQALVVASGLAACALSAYASFRVRLSVKGVLTAALLGRALLLPLPPTLSDDGYRYLWDGLVQTEGVNPYRYPPSAPELAPMQGGELYERLNSRSYVSVYPPASQAVFRAAVGLGGGDPTRSWYALKALLAGMEVGGLLLMARLVSPGMLALYAWHPLPMLEGAGQAHTEAGMVGFIVLALWALRREWGGVAGAALAVAGWFKLVPFFLAAVWARGLGRRGALALLAVAMVLTAPYAASYVLPNVRTSLALYTGLFEWYAGPYHTLKAAGYALTGVGWERVIGSALQGVFVGGVAALAWSSREGGRAPAGGGLVVYGLFLATATTVHPWYLLGVLVFLPFVGGGTPQTCWVIGGWLWLAAWSLPTYLYYTHGTLPYAVSVVVGWGGWVLAMGAGGGLMVLPRLMRSRAREKWRSVRPHVPPSGRLLDLGAGEGYVGELAAGEGYDAVLADVVDFNRSALPLTHLDGDRLPFPDAHFDACLLLYVLHHAEHPEAVLREARRVTRGPLIVLESIAESRWDRWWLPRADRWANRLRSEGGMLGQEASTRFRSAGEWGEAFRELGQREVHSARTGGPLHRKLLVVLEG